MIRFGVIGTNWITEAFIEAARHTGNFVLTAVYSRTEARAAEFAAKHGVPHTFADLEDFAGCPEVDAVYIASPNSYHAQQAIVCMSHGKHVLCEKPIASNAQELRAMQEAARKHGVVLMEAVKSTLHPNFAAVRDNLHKLGTIRRYFAGYCQYSSRYDAYKAGTVLNAFNPVFSNGALMDLGVYCVYPLAVLFGKPDRLLASAYLLESGVDGQGSILLGYPQMDAVIQYSKIADSTLPAEIQGENGTIIIDKISEPGSVRIRYKDGTVEDLTREAPHPTMFYEAEEFIGLIAAKRKESAVNSHASSLIAMEIMDEARSQIGLRYPADDAEPGRALTDERTEEPTAGQIAEWMIGELRSAGILRQEDAVLYIAEHYGEQFIYVNENGNRSIGKEVKKAFRKLHGGRAAWERDGFFWAWT